MVYDSNEPIKPYVDSNDEIPPLNIEGIPELTKSIVVIIDDPDAPIGTWDHWIVWDIPLIESIEEDSVPGTEGLNDFRKHSYGGPCPPSGTHRYFFKIYALDTILDLNRNSRKIDVEKAMKEHILAKGELVGLYKRR